jgi:hypothetical protein
MVDCVRSGSIGKHLVTNDTVDRNRLGLRLGVLGAMLCFASSFLVQGLRQSVVGVCMACRFGEEKGNDSKCLVCLEKEGLVVYVIAGLLLRLPYRRSRTTVLDYWLLEL